MPPVNAMVFFSDPVYHIFLTAGWMSSLIFPVIYLTVYLWHRINLTESIISQTTVHLTISPPWHLRVEAATLQGDPLIPRWQKINSLFFDRIILFYEQYLKNSSVPTFYWKSIFIPYLFNSKEVFRKILLLTWYFIKAVSAHVWMWTHLYRQGGGGSICVLILWSEPRTDLSLFYGRALNVITLLYDHILGCKEPSSHYTWTICWPNVGPPSTTLGQH